MVGARLQMAHGLCWAVQVWGGLEVGWMCIHSLLWLPCSESVVEWNVQFDTSLAPPRVTCTSMVWVHYLHVCVCVVCLCTLAVGIMSMIAVLLPSSWG